MIPQTELTVQRNDWQHLMKNCIRDPKVLADSLNLTLDDLRGAQQAHQDFQVNVPLPYLARIEPGNPNDPLLRQVMASAEEMISAPGYVTDPVGDTKANPIPGLIHKYQGRLLLVASTHCAINCRYCFRRHFPYQDNRLNQQFWQQALAYIKEHPDISEVIYSGGDPLTATDSRLHWLTRQIADIEHVKRLRIHSRMPVVIPQRITDECLDWLTETRLQTVMVLHINHPNEIDEEVKLAASRLGQAGITLLNQSVLLADVNDQPGTLINLSEKLFASGILPYYLHLLDPVQGAAHFDVDEQQAGQLLEEMRNQLPGYLVPKLVREVSGAPYKQPIL